MDTSKLKAFAPQCRSRLIEQVGVKLDYVLTTRTPDLAEQENLVKALQQAIDAEGREQVIERVAYTWFNRFAALRYLDAHGWHPFRLRVITPASENETQPELLKQVRQGVIPDELKGFVAEQRINDLLDGKLTSANPQAEVQRLLLIGVCQFYAGLLPDLFERIDDFSQLLLPDDLLTEHSIVDGFRTEISDEDCAEVEVLGWLYQFYISEKKDEVFAGLKKNKKITPENIPAATQLFTPHWIVRYLVENSLGRLWMLNHPDSKLVEKMEYYIPPAKPENAAESGFLKVSSPEELRICDPACGSGHMLTYAFDLLYAIYEEMGYSASKIPSLILENNLFGIELDQRAGALAAFALTMKARGRHRRFFRSDKTVSPQICVLENVSFEPEELVDYTAEVGQDLFTDGFRETLSQFEEADNVGSLIEPKLQDISEVARIVEAQDFVNNLFLSPVHKKVQAVLRMTDFLSPKYHIVVANPPYMGSKGMNARLKTWAAKQFPDSKSDLFAMFMERGLSMNLSSGMMAMINMQSWMFLSSYEKLRAKLLANATILSMAHLGERGFDSIGGAVVSTTAFVLENAHHPDHKGDYLRLIDGGNEAEKSEMAQQAIRNPDCGWFFRASAEDFSKIPGSPIAYWVSKKLREIFLNCQKLQDFGTSCIGLQTGDNSRFTREWHEISFGRMGLKLKGRSETVREDLKWFPYNKGGGFRRWSGNKSIVVNWDNDGDEIIKYQIYLNSIKAASSKMGIANNSEYYFRHSISWSKVSSGNISFRDYENGFIFDVAGTSYFPTQNHFYYLGLLNSRVIPSIVSILSPTLNYESGAIRQIPVPICEVKTVEEIIKVTISHAKSDWDAYERSWDFTDLPLLRPDLRQPTLSATYAALRQHWQEMTNEMQRLEEENNRIFIDAYGLQDELTPEVPLKEITLTCNPAYRYRGNNTPEELEQKLLADTMREFISYAVACMFGRYSLDAPGLIYAHSGNEGFDPSRYTRFPADDDAIIPITEDDWFEDDAASRVKEFLRVTFGPDTLEENLTFLEQSLGKNLRKYFTTNAGGFYADHVQTYKKRPIYWMFESPKKHFRALVYLHRYTKDTVNTLLNGYLREFRHKLTHRRDELQALIDSESAKPADRKALVKTNSAIKDVEEYERDILLPLAQQRLEIDLDDGVKVNYPKFGKALAKVAGLS